MRKVWFGLVGLALVGLIGIAVVGCGTTAKTLQAAIDAVTQVGTSEVTLSGSIIYSSGSVDINLNAVLVSGEPISLTTSKVKVRVGSTSTDAVVATPVTVTIPTVTDRPMDMVFILDNTGSMAGRIRAVKDSIAAFAASLEAAGTDVKFGVVSFGDTTAESTNLPLPASAGQVSTWLASLEGVSGGDSPENPLTAVMLAFNTFTWRSGAQRVFVLITDNPCHQLGDGTDYTEYTVALVLAAIEGKATLYAVSPKMYQYPTYPYSGYSVRTTTEGDVRWLADGYGWFYGITGEAGYGSERPFGGTGGKWIELPASGNINLTTLGISSAVTAGATLRFSYTFDSGTYYIFVEIDTDGDGVFDSNMLIKVSVTSASSTAFATFGNPSVVAAGAGRIVEGVKPGAGN